MKNVQIQETVHIYADEPVEVFIKQVREAAAPLIDPVVDQEREYDITVLNIVGWREATEKECQYLRDYRFEQNETREQREKAEYERLKAKFDGA